MPEETAPLAGRRALVTGASRGIGKAIALALAGAGADVACVARSVDRAQGTAEAVEVLGRRAMALACDVADPERVAEVVGEVREKFGSLDILVNNAGVAADDLLIRMSDERFARVIDVNLKGAFHFTRAAARHMMKVRWGRIVNVTSVVGLTGNAGQANYAASKAALIGFTMSVARELAGRKVNVNAVAPGLVETDMTDAMPPAALEALIASVPLGRVGRPEDVAEGVLFLVGPSGDYVTGQVLVIDGGLTA